MATIGERASLYVRLSKEAKNTNLSLAGMMRDVRALARNLGFEILSEYVDDGVSGAVRDRTAFLAWLDDARSGRVQALLTYHADRLTREGVNAAALILDVVEGKDEKSGRVVRPPVRFADVKGIDSERSPDSFRLQFVIGAEIARAERERMRDRNRDSYRRLSEAGRYTGGLVPYGLRVKSTPDGKVLVEDPDEAAILNEVADRILGGETLRGATRWLNDVKQARTRRGLHWQRSSLVFTLKSRAGRRLLGDEKQQLVAAVIHHPAKPRKPGRPAKHLLVGGRAVCGSCGLSMVVSGVNYICRSCSTGLPCPRPVAMKAVAVDEYIEQVYLSRHGHEHPVLQRLAPNRALDEARRSLNDAQAAMLAEPSDENVAAFRSAKDQLAFEQGRPTETRQYKVLAPETHADLWGEADVPARQALLDRTLLADGPVVVQPNPRRQSRAGVNFDRLVLTPSDSDFWARIQRAEDAEAERPTILAAS